MRRLGRVLNAKTDGDRAALQALLEALFHLPDFSLCGGAARSFAGWQKRHGFFHRGHARGEMSGADTVIDQRFPFAFGVPTIDVASADFEFQRTRHTIERFETKVFFVLAVLVQIDETRRNDEAARVDHVAALETLARDRFDLAARYAEVADGVSLSTRDRSRGRSESRGRRYPC